MVYVTRGNMDIVEVLETPSRFKVKPSALLCLAGFLVALAFLAGCGEKTPASQSTVVAGTAQSEAPKVAVKLSPEEQKEVDARDDLADSIAKELHARVPAFKNVSIYADNYAGSKSPSRHPQTDKKTRVGDNLMLVFSSQESATAKGLADFTKSKAAQRTVDAGFAELQFVDPDTYCFATIAPVSGVGPVKCGPR